jgi:hypothetical protein
MAITWGGHTTYVEVKYLKPKEPISAFKKHFAKLQLTMAELLEAQGRCWYFVAYTACKGRALRAAIIRPHRLAPFVDALTCFDGTNFQAVAECDNAFPTALDYLVFLARRS